MATWLIWCFFGIILFITEVFTPAMFFLNLAIAAFFAAIPAYFGLSFTVQTFTFFIMSVILLLLLRPILISKQKTKSYSENQGMSEYINKPAKVIEEVGEYSGRVAIYDENWDARSIDKMPIAVGEMVKIKYFDNLVMYVEKEKN